MHLIEQLVSESLQVSGFQDGQDRLGAHVRFEHIAIGLFQFSVTGLGYQLVGTQVFQFVDGRLELLLQLAFFRGQLLLYCVDLGLDGNWIRYPFFLFKENRGVGIVFGYFRDLFSCFGGNFSGYPFRNQLFFAGLIVFCFVRFWVVWRSFVAVQLGFKRLCPGLSLPTGFPQFQFKFGLFQLNGFQAHVFVHGHDDVLGEVEDSFQISGRQVQKQTEPAWRGLAEPDVGHGSSQADMTHALTPDFGAGYFHSAAVADHTAITDALVFAAEALPVLGGSEQPLAKEAVFLRAQGAVIDGLRFGYLAVRPVEYLFRGSNGYADRIEVSPRCFRPVYHPDH